MPPAPATDSAASTRTRSNHHHKGELPPRWDRLFNVFRTYAGGYVARHFHAVRLSKSSAPFPPADSPVLVVLNHPGWWDPLISFVLSREFGEGRRHYAAIDAAAVRKYQFFTRLGFFGVDQDTVPGAAEFLRTGAAILIGSNRALWVTAQGRFSDVRARPLALRSGAGHLAARMPSGYVLPVAFEYTFWTERTPEALVRIGPALDVSAAPGRTGREWTTVIEEALTGTLDGLNREAMTRDPAAFTTLVQGRAGVGGMYDRWRRVTAWLRGERFDPSHTAGGPGGRS